MTEKGSANPQFLQYLFSAAPLGLPKVRHYLASWKEWEDRPELPIEVPKA
jgi:3-mercaptopyruvate sulfurtransferase SseA